MQRLHALITVGAILTAGLALVVYPLQDEISALFEAEPNAPPVLPSASPPFVPLSAGAQYLKLDGKPLFLNGDAAWSLLVVPSEQEAFEYLRTRRDQGFNAVLVNLVEHYVGGPRNQRGDLPFIGAQNFARPNEPYFAHADRVFAEAARLGMIVLLAPAYVGYECGEEGWCAAMRDASERRLQRYGEYVGQRYRNFNNIIWVHGGDADARRYRLEKKVAAVAAGIRRAGGVQLHTAHCARNLSGNACYAELALDFDTAYASCTTTAAAVAHMQARNADGAIRPPPFVYLEGTYENMKESPDCMRDQFLLAMLGGASGHVFGNQPVWDFGTGWKRNLDSPGSRMISTLWRALEPTRSDNWNVMAEPGTDGVDDFTPLLRNDRDGSTAFYARQPHTIDAASLSSAQPIRTCWLDLRKVDLQSKLDPYAPIQALRDSTACTQAVPKHSLEAPYASDWLALTVTLTPGVQHPWERY